MKRIKVCLPGHSYDILIGRGFLGRTGKFLASLKVGKKVLIVSNRKIARTAGLLKPVQKSLSKAAFLSVYYELPHGTERDKSEKVLADVWKTMLRAGLDRSSTLLALGGGVVGDLGGFAASTYMRGINFVQVPTTLLAQVDSAIGGKTAIDLPDGKNAVGTFYQPRLVLSDLDALIGLDQSIFQNSFSEIIKYGVIKDPKLFELLEMYGAPFLSHVKAGAFTKKDFSFLEEIVSRSAAIKASIVERDEKETKGERMILNYGHTFAHVLESASRYGISHGEAVGLGMILAASFARRLGLVSSEFEKRQFHLINQLCPAGSLKSYAGRDVFSWAKLKSLFLHDKKAVGGTVRFVLPVRLGKVKIMNIRKNDWRCVRDSFRALGLAS